MLFQFSGYTLEAVGNGHIPVIKGIIYPILNEYGLKPDEAHTDADLSDIEGNYNQRNGFFCVVYDQNYHPVGTAGLYEVCATTCEIRKIYLKKEARGVGLGKAIVHWLIDQAKVKMYQKIVLETASVLYEAIQMYKKLGFSELEAIPNSPRCDRQFYLDIEK